MPTMTRLDRDDVRELSRLMTVAPTQAGMKPGTTLIVAALLDRYFNDTGLVTQFPNDWKWFIETAAGRLDDLSQELADRYVGVNPMNSPHFADRFDFKGLDSCCHFFQACLRAARYDIQPGSRVLEIGCAEFDWIAEMRRCCPDIEVVGIDWRKHDQAIQGDVLTHDFEPASFDAVVSISAIEHIGLGHYNHDPTDPDGDTHALARAWRWLKPGGVLVFDVPYHPKRYAVCDTSHREYDWDAVLDRLWIQPLVQSATKARWLWEGFAPAKATTQLQTERPTDPVEPFWYAGFVWQKVP